MTKTDNQNSNNNMQAQADTRVELAGVKLKNPVIPASGTFGYGAEFRDLYDLNILGGISFKGTTAEERFGNPLPRIAECPNGMLNAVGLQNPGVKIVTTEKLPELRQYFTGPLIANISGFSVEEYVFCAEAVSKAEGVEIIEVNISCPNVHGGGASFGQDPAAAAEVTAAVKAVTDKPVFMKLTPNYTDIVEVAIACEKAGADGISMINTVTGMRIDIKTRKSILSTGAGGYSGPGIFPIAIAMVNKVSKAVDIPIIGMGGISSAEDVLEMIMAGASAVQIGAANLVDPWACEKICRELPLKMDELGIRTLDEIRGII